MAAIWRHRETGEVAAGFLKNMYDFTYYGALWREDLEQGESEGEGLLSLHGYSNASVWDILEVSEDRLRLFNVKLNNDPQRQLFLTREGTVEARKKEG